MFTVNFLVFFRVLEVCYTLLKILELWIWDRKILRHVQSFAQALGNLSGEFWTIILL